MSDTRNQPIHCVCASVVEETPPRKNSPCVYVWALSNLHDVIFRGSRERQHRRVNRPFFPRFPHQLRTRLCLTARSDCRQVRQYLDASGAITLSNTWANWQTVSFFSLSRLPFLRCWSWNNNVWKKCFCFEAFKEVRTVFRKLRTSKYSQTKQGCLCLYLRAMIGRSAPYSQIVIVATIVTVDIFKRNRSPVNTDNRIMRFILNIYDGLLASREEKERHEWTILMPVQLSLR